MRLRFAAEARSDLLRIGDYIATDNPSRAVSFVRDLRERCASLKLAPLAHPLVPRFSHLGIRKRVVGNYLVFYRIDGDDVVIIRIIHGAQDYDPWLDPPGF